MPGAVESAVARAAQDAVAINMDARLLLPPGQTAVDYGLIERLENGERGGLLRLGRFSEMIEETGVRLAEGVLVCFLQLGGEVFSDKRVRVEGDLVRG